MQKIKDQPSHHKPYPQCLLAFCCLAKGLQFHIYPWEPAKGDMASQGISSYKTAPYPKILPIDAHLFLSFPLCTDLYHTTVFQFPLPPHQRELKSHHPISYKICWEHQMTIVQIGAKEVSFLITCSSFPAKIKFSSSINYWQSKG